MTARPGRGALTACSLLVAVILSYAAILLLVAPGGADAAPPRPQPLGAVAPMPPFSDSLEQAVLLAQQATGGVMVEVDVEDARNTYEVDVLRKNVEIDLDVNVVTGRVMQIGRSAAGD